MNILSFIISIVGSSRKVIEHDIRSETLMSIKSVMDSFYVRWSNKAVAERSFFLGTFRLALFVFLVLLCGIASVADSFSSEFMHIKTVIIADIILIFFVVFSSPSDSMELKKETKRLILMLSKIFLAAAVVTIILQKRLHVTGYENIVSLLSITIFLLLLGTALWLLKLIPYLITAYFYGALKKSKQHESDQLGHFIRYLGLFMKILKGGVLIFFLFGNRFVNWIF
ncbi:hypothetical protein [Belliella pelovolcani]|uniref:Uncharacterized protein n=1 Tax=Belliella pelovolcani TaxID=529505 RepID=A0A1N7ML23_9BACT|nr:hypothetical protein [Belliella pelovolcani]SIS86698.1 hypothetical protein SAMN05421761_106180 [Belliella pelovolcani]